MQTLITIVVALALGFAGSSFHEEHQISHALLSFLGCGAGLILGAVGALCYLGGDRHRAQIILCAFVSLTTGAIVFSGASASAAALPLIFGGLIGSMGVVVVCDTGDDVE